MRAPAPRRPAWPFWLALVLALSIACAAVAPAQAASPSEVKRLKINRPAPAAEASAPAEQGAASAPATPAGPGLGSDKVRKGADLNECLRRRLRGEELDEDCKKLLPTTVRDSSGSGQVGSAAGASTQPPADLGQALAEAVAHSQTNHAVSYDGYEGEFVIEARGDRGGFAKLTLQFDGFYLRPVLTLTQAQQGTIAASGAYADRYQIIPRAVAMTMAMDMTRHCIPLKYGEIYGRFTANQSENFTNPPPPNYESRDLSIPTWINAATGGFLGDKLRFSLSVESRQAIGGEAWLTIDAYAVAPGTSAGRSKSRPADGRIFFSQNHAPGRGHLSLSTGSVSWQLPSRIKVAENFSLTDISLSCAGSEQVTVDNCPSSDYRQESDRQWTVNYRLNIRAKKKIEAVLTALDADSAKYQPLPDDVRSFRVTIKEPSPDQVQAVRFKLENVSSHPGVATNAGNHVLHGQCRDCSLAKEPEYTFINTTFGNQYGIAHPIRRACVHYNDCPIDSLPDLFFSSRENPNFDLSQGGTKDKLQYTVSAQAKPKKVNGDTVEAKVTVKDAAAQGRLKAEVQVAGVWYPVQAQGPSAAGGYLMLPVDKDGNGIADSWDKLWKFSSVDADEESLPGNANRGDGLTVFEEYRGVYWRGRHHRLSPQRTEVFVYDYSQSFSTALSSVLQMYSTQQIDLCPLRADEYKEEVINYHQGGQHKKGDQYIIAIMALSQCTGLNFGERVAGRAYVSPPTAGRNTVVIKDSQPTLLLQYFGNSPDANRSLAGTLAHEIGHAMNVEHHGKGEGLRQVNGKEAWVACRHGEHSGPLDCFMKYNCAEYFLDMDFVPQSSITQFLVRGLLQPFNQSEFGHENGFCRDQKGPGLCGDAHDGNCLGQVKVKSY